MCYRFFPCLNIVTRFMHIHSLQHSFIMLNGTTYKSYYLKCTSHHNSWLKQINEEISHQTLVYR